MADPIAPTLPDLTRAERRYTWRPVVVLDSVDISTQITGLVEVIFEEDAATIARFEYIPAAGPVDLLALVGLSVTIDHYEIGPVSDPDQPWIQRRFTGVLSRPVYRVGGGTFIAECTSDIQGHFEGMTRTAIDAEVGGEYSRHVAPVDADNWRYTQERMKTRAAALWVDASGAVQVTDWAAKATADFTLLDVDIDPGSIQIKSASKRAMVNRVWIDLDYRFWNLRQRELTVSWTSPAETDFCDHLIKGYNLPTKEMFLSAVPGTGWNIKTYSWVELPETQTFNCPIDPWIWVKSQAQKRKCMGASFTVDRRWGQQVTETYQLDIKSSQSITTNGEMGVNEAYGIEAPFDVSEWESPREHEGRLAGATLHGGGSGDWSNEAAPAMRSELDQAQTTVLAKAAAEIKATHRDNQYIFECALHPLMDLSTTVRVTYQATAGAELFKHKVKGKVRALHETLDVESGKATARVTLALSRHGGVGTDPDTPLDPVAQPTPTAETPFSATVGLGFRAGPYTEPGGAIAVPNLGDDDYNGYTCNELVALGAGEQYYDEGLTVIIPEIELAAIDTQTLVSAAAFTVDVPHDEFEIYK